MGDREQYWLTSLSGAMFELEVRQVDRLSTGHPATDPVLWRTFGFAEALRESVEAATLQVGIALREPGERVTDAVLFGTLVADRLAQLADGVVHDVVAQRFFAAGGWRVHDPVYDVDPREHVSIHGVRDASLHGSWAHTHGLVKFGRHEFEVYDVPEPLQAPTSVVLLELAAYVLGGPAIESGHTVGDPSVPLYAREGRREREHWGDLPVLELVDVDPNRGPVESGAALGIQALLASVE